MNNTRNKVRLTENQLHTVIKESVKQILSEINCEAYNPNAKEKVFSLQMKEDTLTHLPLICLIVKDGLKGMKMRKDIT